VNRKIAVLCISIFALALFAGIAVTSAQTTSNADVVAAITQIENDSVKADLANDKAFYEKLLAADWTGGDSSGKWYTKADELKMMDEPQKNKMNTETLSDVKVRVHGGVAIATYKDTYDALVNGEHRARVVITTDVFVKMGGDWKQEADHSSQIK
jgi:hypothetical protein